MGIGRGLFRYARWAVVAYGLTVLAVVVQTATFKNPPFEDLAPADVIVCLGAGMTKGGTLHHDSRTRVRTCVALFEAGVAPIVHFTGGRADTAGPSAGAQMALLAQELGLPADAVSIEDASHSTLQNALFSQPMLSQAQTIRLVTEGFHLPRSYASFAVMGPHEISLTMSEPVRLRPDSGWNWSVLFREALAIWFNAARYLIWLGGGLIGVEGRDALLV